MSRPRAVVVVTGSELVRGDRTDLNGPFLAREALRLGLEPARIAIVGDAPTELEATLRDALAADDVKRRLAQEGAEPMPTTPEEHAAVLDREDTKWSAIIKSAGIEAK